MKKIILTVVFAFALSSVSAQEKTVETKTDGFNKWSIELAGGFNKPQRPFTPGYFTSTPSPYVVDFGVRYMFNNKFGLKADFGYNSFQNDNDSFDFDTKYYRIGLQGVINAGRVLNFETWTKTIGLLFHGGFGVAQLEDQNHAVKDRTGNFIAGVTGQIKLSDRFALTGDFTTILSAKQDLTYDAASVSGVPGFHGILFNGTVGLTYYLGKNAKHADWYADNKINELEAKLTDLETKLTQDTDKDGVPDYRDEESITPEGAVVDSKGRSLDKNNNGVPDATEAYILKNYGNPNDKSGVLSNNDVVTSLVNGGYVALYFDFNKSTPTESSVDGASFMLAYLKNNPSASVDIIGSADEIGNSEYNKKLSNERAAYAKNLLVKAGIDASRLNIVANGEDKSVDKNSDDARKLVRKVTFKVK